MNETTLFPKIHCNIYNTVFNLYFNYADLL